MSIIDAIFGRKKDKTANIAKERLQIIVQHQREGRSGDQQAEPPFMKQMRKDILMVVNKYFDIKPEDIEAHLDNGPDKDIISLSINISDKSK